MVDLARWPGLHSAERGLALGENGWFSAIADADEVWSEVGVLF